jgi:hypothetical protein
MKLGHFGMPMLSRGSFRRASFCATRHLGPTKCLLQSVTTYSGGMVVVMLRVELHCRYWHRTHQKRLSGETNVLELKSSGFP